MQPDSRFAALSRSMREYFAQGLYDAVNYPVGGAAVFNFFAIPLGQAAVLTTAIGAAPAAGTIKTYRDTNMESANFIPDKTYMFSGMSTFIRRVNTGVAELITDHIDRYLIVNNGWWHFRVGDKDILYVPYAFVPIFNGLTGSSWAGTDILNQGVAIPQYGFATPITIEPGQTLRVTLEYPGLVPITTTLDIQLMLHAMMQRPV